MKKSDNEKEMLFLISYKSHTGLILYVAIFGLLLMVVSLLCPFCSYNPTVLDELKRNVKFFDLSYIVILATTLLIVASILAVLCIMSLSKSDWRAKIKKFTVYPIIAILCVIVAVGIVAYACIFYKIPESKFDYLETQMEIGFYLFTIGSLMFSLAFFVFSFGLKNLANGKTTIEKLTLIKKGQINNEDSTLTEKLTELQKLKDDGMITDEEYKTKKEDLLKKFE